VPTKTKEGFQASHVKDEATATLRRWMSYQVDWVNVALSQGSTDDRSALSKKMCFKRGDQVCWNVVELSLINLLEWFRDVGEPTFPTIATLARIWLGKVSSSAFKSACSPLLEW
jgi:hypothetical protein